MTNSEKEKIRELRMQGLGYGTVAKEMGMNLNTVKAYCRRHGPFEKKEAAPVEKQDTVTGRTTCKNCGTKIMQIKGRKEKKFCCDRCRNKWWNAHLDQVQRKSYYEIKCKNCGKIFTFYGDGRRKYCCHACYIEDRFRHSTPSSK